MSDALTRWIDEQRALAAALGLSVDNWLTALEAAGNHRAGLSAAVIGASMARRRGMPNLSAVDGPALAARARALIDPAVPAVQHPVLAEAIRRADGLADGAGARRLRTKAISRPDRAAPSTSPSADQATPDAPGQPE